MDEVYSTWVVRTTTLQDSTRTGLNSRFTGAPWCRRLFHLAAYGLVNDLPAVGDAGALGNLV